MTRHAGLSKSASSFSDLLLWNIYTKSKFLQKFRSQKLRTNLEQKVGISASKKVENKNNRALGRNLLVLITNKRVSTFPTTRLCGGSILFSFVIPNFKRWFYEAHPPPTNTRRDEYIIKYTVRER